MIDLINNRIDLDRNVLAEHLYHSSLLITEVMFLGNRFMSTVVPLIRFSKVSLFMAWSVSITIYL